jgi:hypothetical protein
MNTAAATVIISMKNWQAKKTVMLLQQIVERAFAWAAVNRHCLMNFDRSTPQRLSLERLDSVFTR